MGIRSTASATAIPSAISCACQTAARSARATLHTGFQSLKRLADGDNDTLAAVDGSTVYHGWNDLVGTLRAIIDFERGQARSVQLNVAELDPQINPGDHSDHLMTAKAAIAAASDSSCVRLVSYVDYASSKLPENLDLQQRDMESSVFAVTLAGVQALGQPTSWQHYDKSYVGRNYFRVQDEPASCRSVPDRGRGAPQSAIAAGRTGTFRPLVAVLRSDRLTQVKTRCRIYRQMIRSIGCGEP